MMINKIDSVMDPLLNWHQRHIDDILNERLDGYKASRGLKQLHPVEWMKSTGTLRVNLGRQIGQSSYIARTSEDNDVIFCLDIEYLETMVRRREPFRGQGRAMNVYLVSNYSQINPDIRDVWIDNPSLMSDEVLNNLYQHFSSMCRRFILIG